MRNKALQSRQSSYEDAKSYHPLVESYDELEIFGGRTGLVMPKRALDGITPAGPSSGIRLPSIPNLLHPPSNEVISSVSQPPYRSDPEPQSVYVSSHATSSTSAGSPLNWEGLYREIPDSPYSYAQGINYSNTTAGPVNSPAEGIMLEDRWSSFMQHYALAGDVQIQTHH